MPFGFPATGSGYPGAVASVDSIESVGTMLTTIDATGFNDGDLIYVGNETFAGQGSIKDYVRVRRNASLTPTEGEVWNSAAGSSIQFERLHTPSDAYFQKFVFFITGNAALGTGIIDNDGQSSGRPISMREAERRRAGDSQGIGSSITLVLIDDLGSPARSELLPVKLSNWKQTDGNAAVILIGQPTVDFSGTITTSVPANTGDNANGGYILVGTGFGTNATVGKALRVNAGDDNDVIHAVVAQIIDADTIRTSQPRKCSAANFNSGSPTPWVEGSTLEFLTNRRCTIWPFIPEQLKFTAAQYIDFSGFDSEFNEGSLGDSSPFIIACTIDGVGWFGGDAEARFAACGFLGFGNIINPALLNIMSCNFGPGPGGALGRMNIQGGSITASDDNCLTHCDLNLYGGATWIMAGGSSRALSIFDNTSGVGAVHVGTGLSCYYQSDGVIYGGAALSGVNTGRIFFVPTGGYVRVSKVGITVTTSAPFALLLEDGTAGDYAFADISIPNPLGGGIVDPASP